jgi:hypothetical protein
MKTFINILSALATTALVIASPALIAWGFYQIDTALAGPGLALGLFVGPYVSLQAANMIEGW